MIKLKCVLKLLFLPIIILISVLYNMWEGALDVILEIPIYLKEIFEEIKR